MNYLWGGLILVSVLFATIGDLYDLYTESYENDRLYELQLNVDYDVLVDHQQIDITLLPEGIELVAEYRTDSKRSQLLLQPSEQMPAQWQSRFSEKSDEQLVVSVEQAKQTQLMVTLPSIVWPRLERMMQAAFDMADFAAKLAIGLIGLMALWLGLMKIAEQSGLVDKLVKLVRPVLRPLFPEVPDDHPAMGTISLNLAANMLGLGNAATPLGIKAMQHLQELNAHKDTASNSMCMFLALNTSSVQLLPPVTVIALLGVGAGGLFVSIFLATLSSTIVAIIVALWYARRRGSSK